MPAQITLTARLKIAHPAVHRIRLEHFVVTTQEADTIARREVQRRWHPILPGMEDAMDVGTAHAPAPANLFKRGFAVLNGPDFSYDLKIDFARPQLPSTALLSAL
jgi:hypothetical protein